MEDTRHYEVELKCLLESAREAEELKDRMLVQDPRLELLGVYRQLNHYFVGGALGALPGAVGSVISRDKSRALEEIVAKTKDYSLRTRNTDGRLHLVLKSAVDDTTSANGIIRLEFEAPVAGVTHEGLDDVLLGAGFRHQSKWSRERREYKFLNTTASIDKNAGYGHLAEFETIADSLAKVDGARGYLRAVIADLGLKELAQDRLERMFAYYNAHWPEYYGTDKTFMVK